MTDNNGNSNLQELMVPRPVRYRFEFRMEGETPLPGYTGSTWRGLLGHGLRYISCMTGKPSCAGCLLSSDCVYYRLFEGHQGRTARSALGNPHPFVLGVPGEAGRKRVRPGDSLNLEITLMGMAEEWLPHIALGLVNAGRLGIGRERAPFELVTVRREPCLGRGGWQEIGLPRPGWMDGLPAASVTIPEAPTAVQIELVTPLRTKRRGRLLGPREFVAGDFLRQLWRRARDLSDAWGRAGEIRLPVPVGRWDCFDGSATCRVRWHDWSRYSSRQKTRMQMGGLVGSLRLDGEALEEWWPLLWIGQWFHLGKGTSMGLGCYRTRSTDGDDKNEALGKRS